MSNPNPIKPKKNHPWRTPLEHMDWAKKQSDIRNVNNVTVARPSELSRRDRKQAEV